MDPTPIKDELALQAHSRPEIRNSGNYETMERIRGSDREEGVAGAPDESNSAHVLVTFSFAVLSHFLSLPAIQ